MNEEPQLTEFGAVLQELAREKGAGSLNEFFAAAREAGHDITAEEFDGLVWDAEDGILPRQGFMGPIKKALGLDAEEARRLHEAFLAYVLADDPLPDPRPTSQPQ